LSTRSLGWLLLVLLLTHTNGAVALYEGTEGHLGRLDVRYCGRPDRDSSGRLSRSTSAVKTFQHVHPCPSTGSRTGPCPGWIIDHVVPLACGGCDVVHNMQWLPKKLKVGKPGKDSWERKVYAAPERYPDTDSCKNQVVSEEWLYGSTKR
jgi:hypothetical protein